jgi:hypothetical protein
MLNKLYCSPLYLAILNENKEVADYLVSYGALPYQNGTDKKKDMSAVFLAVRKNDIFYLDMMLDFIQEKLIKDSFGLTP